MFLFEEKLDDLYVFLGREGGSEKGVWGEVANMTIP